MPLTVEDTAPSGCRPLIAALLNVHGFAPSITSEVAPRADEKKLKGEPGPASLSGTFDCPGINVGKVDPSLGLQAGQRF